MWQRLWIMFIYYGTTMIRCLWFAPNWERYLFCSYGIWFSSKSLSLFSCKTSFTESLRVHRGFNYSTRTTTPWFHILWPSNAKDASVAHLYYFCKELLAMHGQTQAQGCSPLANLLKQRLLIIGAIDSVLHSGFASCFYRHIGGHENRDLVSILG